MNLNLFQISVILLVLLGTGFLWYKYKLNFITNYITGGLILIFLCKLNFLGWERNFGKFGVIIFLYIFFSYSLLHISTLFTYLFKSKKIYVFPSSMFLIIAILTISINDKNISSEFRLGTLVRLFLAFFPLLFFSYYKKHTKTNQKFEK